MKTKYIALVGLLAISTGAIADVTSLARNGQQFKVGDKPNQTVPRAPEATGAQALTDQSGFEYFVNTDITFTTTSSASGAASEASYSTAVAATTLNGGTVSSSLNDAFDGYNSVCFAFTTDSGPCTSGTGGGGRGINPYIMYNGNGAATLDASCSNRQVIFPAQTIAPGVTAERKVFVPLNDEFARWQNIVTNTSASAVTLNIITSTNLGSDANTTVVTTSSGDAVATTADNWVTTFQNFSGTTSSDPRLGHVLGGPGAAVGLNGVNFANGDDNPFWSYRVTIQPGQTVNVVNFVTGQPSRADAAAKASELVNLTGNAAACMTASEVAQVVNYASASAGQNREVPLADKRVLLAVAGMLLALGFVALRRSSV